MFIKLQVHFHHPSIELSGNLLADDDCHHTCPEFDVTFLYILNIDNYFLSALQRFSMTADER